MNLPAFSIENKVCTYFIACLLVLAGIWSFFSLGRLEDPTFTIKTALVTTAYPGASPEEVELEVTNKIERELQQLPELKYVQSLSRAGISNIEVGIKAEYWADRIPQVWDKVRRKVNDVVPQLPAGAGIPNITDDFGDVFGLLLALSGEGFSIGELKEYAKLLRKELSLVKGVARVELWGDQASVIYIDVNETRLATVGLSMQQLLNALQDQNLVIDAGHVEIQSQRLRIASHSSTKDTDDIASILIAGVQTANTEQTEFIRLGDIGTVSRGYTSPPLNLLRINGQPGIALAISNQAGTNVVKMGEHVEQRLQELQELLPIGIKFDRIHWQSDIIDDAINSFLTNFMQALLIVLAVLTLAMGWRMGIIISSALLLTIAGTLTVMQLTGTDMHRMSLGALIIALGMMVDNAIVVADRYINNLDAGMDAKSAALEAAGTPLLPLLGATIIAIMAFYPVAASSENAGEYCRSLFTVVSISLLISWLISITVTPLQCMGMLSGTQNGKQTEKWLYRNFRRLLTSVLRLRWISIGLAVLILASAFFSFGSVSKIFFPYSSMSKFMVDYWAPEGTHIEALSKDLRSIEAHLQKDHRIKTVASFIGQGPPRFYLPITPEKPYASYAQLIVNVDSFSDLEQLTPALETWLNTHVPTAMTRVRRYSVGPGITWPLEVRFSGPANASNSTLKRLAAEGADILRRSGAAQHIRTDWRQQTLDIVPTFSQNRGQRLQINREMFADTLKRSFDGINIAHYREEDEILPIILRQSRDYKYIDTLDVINISTASGAAIPLSQVLEGVTYQWHDPLIWRYNRRRAITLQASPKGMTFDQLRAKVAPQFEAIALPPGYEMHWFGEYDASVSSRKSLAVGIVPALACIAIILVALFNALRPVLAIFLTIPFILIGIIYGLLVTKAAFGFVALLGAMSLVGMMIKNGVVLIDQINLEQQAGKPKKEAVIDATVSRLRPVLLAAGTTVLGVIPLYPDIFWQGLAVSIMAGLSVGTVLTMLILPSFYSLLHRI